LGFSEEDFQAYLRAERTANPYDAFFRPNGTASMQQILEIAKANGGQGTVSELVPDAFQPMTKWLCERQTADRTALGQSAEAINSAFYGINDVDTVCAILQDKTQAERSIIDEQYKSMYGVTLDQAFRSELSGSDLDRALNLLYRRDGS